jgi:hypothetical protein
VALSKREKYIGIVAAIVVGVPVLNAYLVSPLTSRLSAAEAEVRTQMDEHERATRLFSTERSARREFAAMTGGAMHEDRAGAEGQILNHVREWAQESGINLSSLKPEREEQDKRFQKITFRATATGGMSQVGRFLHRIQTASIPVRVTDMQLSSQRDGTDDLTLSVALATIYAPPDADKTPGRSANAAAVGETR